MHIMQQCLYANVGVTKTVMTGNQLAHAQCCHMVSLTSCRVSPTKGTNTFVCGQQVRNEGGVVSALYPVGVLLHAEAEQVNDERERRGRCAGRVRLLSAGLARVRQHRYELRYVLVIEQLQELVALRLRTCKRGMSVKVTVLNLSALLSLHARSPATSCYFDIQTNLPEAM